MSQDEATPKNLFLQSVDRCASSEGFIPAFYIRFLSNSNEVREKFQDTNFRQQNRMLLRSLRLSAGATAGDLASLREIRERAETHDRHHLNIEPRLYKLWLAAIIETAREFDNEWNDDVEAAWRAVLAHVIDHMVRYY